MIYLLNYKNSQLSELETFIKNKLEKFKNVLHLAPDKDVKHMRIKAGIQTCVDKETFVKTLSTTKNCLTEFEEQSVLYTVICHYYSDNVNTMKSIHKNIKELYKLYTMLLFEDKKISAKHISAINADFTFVESDVFQLFELYQFVLQKITSLNKTDDLLEKILGKDFWCNIPVENIKIHAQSKHELIISSIQNTDVLVFDSFINISEFERYMLVQAARMNKTVFVILKDELLGKNDFCNDFVCLIKKELLDYNYIKLTEHDININENATSLEDVRNNYYEENCTLNTQDNSLKIIKPFHSVYSELLYVATDISVRLRNYYNNNNDVNGTVDIFYNEIAVIIHQNMYQELSSIFHDIGMFVLKKENLNSQKEVDLNTLNKIYFAREDFLNTVIRFKDGKELTRCEKYTVFDEFYSHIEVTKSQNILKHPLTKFVCQIYYTINNGINVCSFKQLIFLLKSLNNTKYKDLLSEFEYIELYVKREKTIHTWKECINKLCTLKPDVEKDMLYLYHPLTRILPENLEIFRLLIEKISDISDKINAVDGDVHSHITTFCEVIDIVDDFILTNNTCVISRMKEKLSCFSKTHMSIKINPHFFANNLESLLSEICTDTSESNNLPLNVISVDNQRKFKYCYFVDTMYKHYEYKFPFTHSVIKILQNPEYGIECDIGLKDILKNSTGNQISLFRNILLFTENELIITYCKNSTIISTFDMTILPHLYKLYSGNLTIHEHGSIDCVSDVSTSLDEIPPLFLNKKEKYTLTELAIFKLCPKLYYHRRLDGNAGAYLTYIQMRLYMEAVLFCDIMRRFMDYNLNNEKIYIKNSIEYAAVIAEHVEESFCDNKKYFFLFTDEEINCILKNAQQKTEDFVEITAKSLKGSSYTVIPYKNKIYKSQGYEVIISHDNRVVDYDKKKWKMSQNNIYLEFLVDKTSFSKSQLIHYADMIDALDNNVNTEDRISLISKIISKINIQFDSKRFSADALKRTDDLVDQICKYDFSKAEVMKSKYCNYCRLNNVCLGK